MFGGVVVALAVVESHGHARATIWH